MTRRYPIDIPQEAIEAFCREHHIRRLSLFGSILRDDFGPESDIDVLVEFEEGKTPGLAYFGLGARLAEILGRPVDLLTTEELGPDLRARVLPTAEVLYDAA